ncbi:MAG: STAS domain-containing protein [Gaiellales bacterium]
MHAPLDVIDLDHTIPASEQLGIAASEQLGIAIRATACGVTIVGVGEIDMASCDRLIHAIDAADAGAGCCIEVDLTAVDFVDASSIGCLIDARTRCEARGIRLELRASAAGPVRRTFDLLGVEDELNVRWVVADA